MREKIIYTLDNSNRLIIKRKGKTIIPDGRFGMEENRLFFWLNEPPALRRQYRLPRRINLDGRWRLNDERELEIVSDKYADGRLILKINIISASHDALIFGVNQIDNQGQSHLRILKLSGSWRSDAYNRINFIVEKKVLSDTLIFKSEWQINKNQQIVYLYETADLKTKAKIKNSLIFEGFWQINSNNRLTYIFEQSRKSRFDFRVQLETPNIYPQKGVIKYRVGIGARKERIKKVIYLYGEWKFSRKLGLIFQMDYGKGKIMNINFSAVVHFKKENEIVFSLINKINEPLGINVIFTHRFLKMLDAETFLRIKRTQRESGLEAGLRIPF
ncbi:MAG: hypothetical protein NC936_00265 [Candidatus Omnitrophica bacterium]|nr:hypothetical protein [Candidatus Omnitrophota bacterium]